MTDAALPEAPRASLSDDLRSVLEAAGGKSMRIRDMVEILHGRGLQIIVVLLCLPFLAPVTIPGISIPFGLAIALCGLRIAFGHKPWLPAFILDRHISHHALERMVHFACAFYGRLEKITRPRMLFFLDGPGMTMFTGVIIALAGLLLSLPIPPPFPLTNTIPGLAIILLSLGLMERDGILIVVGYVLTLIGAVYVTVIALLGKAGAIQLWRVLFGG